MECDKETLENLILEGLSYDAIGKIYKVTGASIRKWAKKLGVELPKRRKINSKETFNRGQYRIAKKTCLNCGIEINGHYKYCSHKCQQEYQYKLYIQRWKDGLEDGISGKYDISDRIKRYLFEKFEYKCQKCGWNEQNPYTNKVPLQVHHVDGNCLNNKEDNLELLCPNCHSLTDTFGNLNKNSKRVYRRQKGNI